MNDEFILKKEVLKILGKSNSYLANLRKLGLIKFVKLSNKTIYYDKKSVLAFKSGQSLNK